MVEGDRGVVRNDSGDLQAQEITGLLPTIICAQIEHRLECAFSMTRTEIQVRKYTLGRYALLLEHLLYYLSRCKALAFTIIS